MPQPIILATWSFGKLAVDAGWRVLSGGGDALDAVEQGARAVEADPSVNSVGRGGRPDRSGEPSLDASIMLSPARCGSVCYVRKHTHAITVARLVMERSPHVMLAGAGADAFAELQGMTPTELLTDDARQWWDEKRAKEQAGDEAAKRAATIGPANREEQTDWAKRRGAGGDASSDAGSSDAASRNAASRDADNHRDADDHRDTVGVLALDAKGQLAGACSTSGWPFKLPGRVGDSPIIGHGLYVHPRYGAAVATGHGELVMGCCSTFLAVELMRCGAAPAVALLECLERLADEHKLRDSEKADEQVGMIALTPTGDWAHACLRDGYRTAVRAVDRDETLDGEPHL